MSLRTGPAQAQLTRPAHDLSVHRARQRSYGAAIASPATVPANPRAILKIIRLVMRIIVGITPAAPCFCRGPAGGGRRTRRLVLVRSGVKLEPPCDQRHFQARRPQVDDLRVPGLARRSHAMRLLAVSLRLGESDRLGSDP